ncbi:hypothetical protein KC353_g63 [Hortaea werneckii]|nr:hypothetical protein KC353_g63 [Hortaea werneckii]
MLPSPTPLNTVPGPSVLLALFSGPLLRQYVGLVAGDCIPRASVVVSQKIPKVEVGVQVAKGYVWEVLWSGRRSSCQQKMWLRWQRDGILVQLMPDGRKKGDEIGSLLRSLWVLPVHVEAVEGEILYG